MNKEMNSSTYYLDKIEEKSNVIEKDISDLKISVANNEKDIEFLKSERKRIADNIHDLRDFINAANLNTQLSIQELTTASNHLADTTNKLVTKLDGMTTPKAVGVILGSVAGVIMFGIAIIKFL